MLEDKKENMLEKKRKLIVKKGINGLRSIIERDWEGE